MCCKELAKTGSYESSSTRLAGIQRRDFESVGKAWKTRNKLPTFLYWRRSSSSSVWNPKSSSAWNADTTILLLRVGRQQCNLPGNDVEHCENPSHGDEEILPELLLSVMDNNPLGAAATECCCENLLLLLLLVVKLLLSRRRPQEEDVISRSSDDEQQQRPIPRWAPRMFSLPTIL